MKKIFLFLLIFLINNFSFAEKPIWNGRENGKRSIILIPEEAAHPSEKPEYQITAYFSDGKIDTQKDVNLSFGDSEIFLGADSFKISQATEHGMAYLASEDMTLKTSFKEILIKMAWLVYNKKLTIHDLDNVQNLKKISQQEKLTITNGQTILLNLGDSASLDIRAYVRTKQEYLTAERDIIEGIENKRKRVPQEYENFMSMFNKRGTFILGEVVKWKAE